MLFRQYECYFYKRNQSSKKGEQLEDKHPHFTKAVRKYRPDFFIVVDTRMEQGCIKCAMGYHQKREKSIKMQSSNGQPLFISIERFVNVPTYLLTKHIGKVNYDGNLYKYLKKYIAQGFIGPTDYVALPDHSNFVPIIGKTSYDSVFSIYKNDTVANVQLLSSVQYHYGHIRHKFDHNGVIKPFIYKDGDKYKIVHLNVFYCKDCNAYFDVRKSFLAQLKNAGINPKWLITSYYDENNKEISFFNDLELKEHSKLNMLGYKTGKSGLSSSKRHDIILFALEKKYMTVYEMKNLISSFISYQGKKPGMEYAVEDWESDLIFINSLKIKL